MYQGRSPKPSTKKPSIKSLFKRHAARRGKDRKSGTPSGKEASTKDSDRVSHSQAAAVKHAPVEESQTDAPLPKKHAAEPEQEAHGMQTEAPKPDSALGGVADRGPEPVAAHPGSNLEGVAVQDQGAINVAEHGQAVECALDSAPDGAFIGRGAFQTAISHTPRRLVHSSEI